jgi:hypothetical protein
VKASLPDSESDIIIIYSEQGHKGLPCILSLNTVLDPALGIVIVFSGYGPFKTD